MKTRSCIICLACLALLFSGCSLNHLALTKVASALTAEGSTVFSGDDDPELVGDALPFALKTYESLLASLPDNDHLLIATGKAFCMYAYADVYLPADTLPDTHIEEKTAKMRRAKKLYIRGRDYLLRACEVRHPGFKKRLSSMPADSALSVMTLSDTSLLYWTSLSWMGAFTCDKFDMGLAISAPKAVACMRKVASLDETFGRGCVHDFFVSYYGSMPASMGGSEAKAREEFKRSVELSKGARAGTYVALATSVCVGKQNVKEFTSVLNEALSVDINADPANRLANVLSQERAEWLLAHRENFFLSSEPDSSSEVAP